MRIDSYVKQYSLATRVYVYAFCAVAAAFTLQASAQGKFTHPAQSLLFLVAVLVSSGLKVSLPGITGTLSLNYIFILMGILRLDLLDTMLLSVSASVVQSAWRAKSRPEPIQLCFNTSSLAVAIWVAYQAYHSRAILSLTENPLTLLAVASISYFLVNTVSVSIVIAMTERKNAKAIWSSCYFWSFPYYVLGSSLAVLIDLAAKRFGWEVIVITTPVLYLMYRSYRVYLKQLAAEKDHAEQMAALHLRTIEALALAIEAKDECTHAHLRRVQIYATALGEELGLSESELQALRAAAILHDIGKLAVPDYIISKPGRLTPEEFEKMKIHPIVGGEILERVEFPYPVVPIVRCHHERWDGGGYPNGLKGEEIPIGARILSAVDCLDALATDRPYRRSLPLVEAMKVVVGEAHKAFDPKVVELLNRRYEELEERARDAPETPRTLSTDFVTEHGKEPAAGFEAAGPDQNGERGPVEGAPGGFLASIAAARQEVQTLFEFTQELGSSLSLRETLSVVGARLITLVPFDCIAIYAVDGEFLAPKYVNGENARLFSTLRIPVGQGLSGWVAENQRAILNGNPSVEPGYLNDATRFSLLRSALSAPLLGVNGFRGVLTLYRAERDGFTRDHLRVILAVSSRVSLAIENALSFQQAQQRATTDSLTNLPNASSLFLHLEEEVERARREHAALAILVCDLDGFKSVNDRFGHLHGNKVLRRVSAAFRENCRSYDYVARMGGDEFVLVLPGCAETDLTARLSGLRAAVREIGREACGDDLLDISIGVSCFPQDGADAETLLATADRQMYRIKNTQKLLGPSDRGAPGDTASMVESLMATCLVHTAEES